MSMKVVATIFILKSVDIPYCVSWVNRFFQHFPGRPRRELGRSEIEEFLSETSRRPGVSNWQVQQARNSVETYYEKFRGIPLLPRTSEECPRASEAITSSEGKPPSSIHLPSSGSGVYSRSAPAVKSFQGAFHGTFHGAPQTQKPAAVSGDGEKAAMAKTGLDWRVLEERVRESLRIEHYAYSTAPCRRCSAMPTSRRP